MNETYRPIIYKVSVTGPKEHHVYYAPETKDEVIGVLDRARIGRVRVRIFYGDPRTGRAWGSPPPGGSQCGLIKLERCGSLRIPYVNARKKCDGGAMLERHIVKIETATGEELWKHKLFHTSPSPVKY